MSVTIKKNCKIGTTNEDDIHRVWKQYLLEKEGGKNDHGKKKKYKKCVERLKHVGYAARVFKNGPKSLQEILSSDLTNSSVVAALLLSVSSVDTSTSPMPILILISNVCYISAAFCFIFTILSSLIIASISQEWTGTDSDILWFHTTFSKFNLMPKTILSFGVFLWLIAYTISNFYVFRDDYVIVSWIIVSFALLLVISLFGIVQLYFHNCGYYADYYHYIMQTEDKIDHSLPGSWYDKEMFGLRPTLARLFINQNWYPGWLDGTFTDRFDKASENHLDDEDEEDNLKESTQKEDVKEEKTIKSSD